VEVFEERRHAELERRSDARMKDYSEAIFLPSDEHLDETNKLNYTVWTWYGYDYDYGHSREGPPSKNFDSSFDTVEEANERVEYVFYEDCPFTDESDDIDDIHVESDTTNSEGFRRLESEPLAGLWWIVSVVPSAVFDHRDD